MLRKRGNRMYAKGTQVATLTMLLALVTAVASFAQNDEEEQYEAFGVNMSGSGPSGGTTFNFAITRWTSAEERDMLLQTLKEKGHDDFVKALREQQETGWMRWTDRGAASPGTSTRLHYAWRYEDDKGQRHITLVTNRVLRMREAASNSNSVDYDVSMATLEFPPVVAGATESGEGQFYWALKISSDEKTGRIKVEQAGTEAFRLTKVERKK